MSRVDFRRPSAALLLAGLLLAAPSALPYSADDTDAAQAPHVLMHTTLGPLLLELDPVRAPISTENFLAYVDAQHYDGTIFHRVLTDFMAQGGGFDLELRQKPTRAPIKNEADNGLKNVYGTLAMARTNTIDSATSQFFINAVDNPFLDHRGRDVGSFGYCVFGKLVGGLDTFERLRRVEVTTDRRVGGENAFPVEPVVIESARRVAPEQVADLKANLLAQIAKAEAALHAKTSTGLAFLASQGLDIEKGVQDRHGLFYLDEVVGQGPTPRPQDPLELHYTGWLDNGTRFVSSHDEGQPIVHPLTRFIQGWQQGVATMQAGGVRWLVIPSELAYGKEGQEPNIPPDATLVFKVELLRIPRHSQHEEALAFLASQGLDPSKGSFTPSGLWILDVVKGEGVRPQPGVKVTVHYTGWLPNGESFDSSRRRNSPSSFSLNQVIAGWTEGVGTMLKGGRRWLVIPYDLAYGEQGRPPTIPPKATLIFDVELLDY